MITVVRKKWGLSYRQYWFARSWSLLTGLGFTTYRQYLGEKAPGFPFFKDKRHTMLIDVGRDDEALLAGMNKNMRSQLRKAEGDGFVWREEKDLELFRQFFNAFAQEKGLTTLERSTLESEKENLFIGKIDAEGRTLAAHAYLIDRKEGRGRFLYGASVRFDAGVDTALVGRANRLGHFLEMKQFRAMGLSTFDFGGYAKDTTDKQKQGINQFKEAFGGSIVEESTFDSIWFALIKLVKGRS